LLSSLAEAYVDQMNRLKAIRISIGERGLTSMTIRTQASTLVKRSVPEDTFRHLMHALHLSPAVQGVKRSLGRDLLDTCASSMSQKLALIANIVAIERDWVRNFSLSLSLSLSCKQE
jgi:hypothetical protein